MWKWLTRLFNNRSHDRFVFVYHDGSRTRSADPVEVERLLLSALGDDWRDKLASLAKPAPFGVVGDQAESWQADRAALRTNILAAVDAAFGVEPYTDHAGQSRPTGLTQAQRYGLLEGYLRFCADLVAIARPFPSSQPRASPSPASPPPASGPASTSPASGSPSAAPPTSPTP